jgi:hypothetical protein
LLYAKCQTSGIAERNASASAIVRSGFRAWRRRLSTSSRPTFTVGRRWICSVLTPKMALAKSSRT